MIVGVPKEAFSGERRVALVPVVVPNLMKAGFQVLVEAGAGASAGYPDADDEPWSRRPTASPPVRPSGRDPPRPPP